jgi:hypothetical protein
MVRANGANTNSEIRTFFRTFFHRIRQPKDRRSMHPSRPREADWVAARLGPAQGTREPPKAGRRRPRFARLLRPSPHRAACARP